MQFLRQSTAFTVTVGPILDSAGAEYTSAVIGDLSIRKHDGSVAAMAAAATLTHVANGHYTLVGTTGNSDTLGRVDIHCNKSGYQMPPKCFDVIPAMVYDSFVLGTDRFDVNVTHIGDTAQTARDIGASVLLSNGTGTGQVKLASGYVAMTWADIAAPTTVVNLSGTTVKTATDVETATTNIKSRLPVNLVGGRMVSDVSAIDNASIGAAPLADLLTSWNANGYLPLPPITANWLTAAGLATDAVTEIQTGLSTLTQANVADAVWNAATATYGAAGSYGLLVETNLDAAVTTRMATYTQPTGFLAATFPTTVASTTNITAGTITTVTNLTNAPTAGDFTTTMKTSIGTAVAASAVASVTGAVGSVVGNVGGNVVGSVGSVVGAVGSVTGAVGSVTGNVGGNVVGTVGGIAGTTTTLDALQTALNSAHGAGSWATATGFAVAGDAMTLTSGERTAIATAWGASVVGNSRTRDMYLQGLTNKIAFAADGLTYTLYASDDTTTLFTGTATRLATTVGGLRSVDPA